MGKPYSHYNLNYKQLYILKLVYKFRFVTAPLLARYLGLKSRHAVYESLELLVNQDYLEKRVDTNEAFQNKGARYYLAPKARRLLHNEHNFNQQTLHIMRSNNKLTEGFLDSTIDVLRVLIAIRESHPDTFDIFTQYELADFDYFPSPPPALYLNRFKHQEGEENEYLLEIFGDTQLFVIMKRIKIYIEHFDDGDWEQATDNEYPTVLLVCNNGRIEKRLQEAVAKELKGRGMDDEMFFYTTTIKALLGSDVDTREVWSDVLEPDKLLSLSEV